MSIILLGNEFYSLIVLHHVSCVRAVVSHFAELTVFFP